MYQTTRELVAALEAAGELARVKATVSPVLEITEFADRQSKSPAPHPPAARTRASDPRFHHLGGRALFFESVEGSDIPVVINQFGSYRRMEIALGCNDAGAGLQAGATPGGLEALAERLGKLIKPEPPPTLLAKLRKLPELVELARMPPKRVSSGICHETVLKGDQVDLTRLPLLRCWPLDGDFTALGYAPGINDGIAGLESGPEWDRRFRGRYITIGGIHTIHRDDMGHPAPPSRNIGMYRVQLLGKRHLAMHWHMHHDGARHWRSWKARGEKMPVAIALGGESVLPYAATAPMPPGISELLLAGFLNRGAIPLCPCATVPLEVPANSEIVIEGYVRADAGMPGWPAPRRGSGGVESENEKLGPGAVFEGPFGDHTGFYSLPDRYPLLEVTAITHRRNPIFPATVVGLPPQEDYFMGKATERLFLPLLRTIVPDVIDYDLPMFGAFHNCAFIKIRKEYPLQARRIMHAIWGAGQMAWTKTIFVVDEDVDVHDAAAVLRSAAERCRPGYDVETVRGPLDILDHAAPHLGAGTKIGFDCTRRWPGEEVGVRERVAVSIGGLSDAKPVQAKAASRERVLETARAVSGVLDASLPTELGCGWLFVRIEKAGAGDGPRVGAEIVGRLAAAGLRVPTVMPLGPGVDVENIDEALFHWCANFDFGRDARLIGDESGDGRGVVAQVFDATPKVPGDAYAGLPVRDWPPIIRMSDEVRERVAGRAGEL